MSQIVNVVSHAQASETSAPSLKRHCPELANPSETFQSIRNEGYRTATYEVDTSVRQEEEHPRDPAILLAPVFVHTQQFSTPPPVSGNKPPSQVNQRILYRVGAAGPGSQRHAAVKLASELGRGPDWDSPLEQSISFSIHPLVRWHKSMGSVKPTDHSVKLHIAVQKRNQMLRDTVIWDLFQPYNSPQQYAAGVCDCLGLRFDWYKIIVAAVDSLLTDIWEECSRQGSVSLQRVTAADVGVQEQQQQDAGPRAEAPRDPSCSTPEDCVMLDVDEPANTNKNAPEKGPIVVSIQLTASSDTAKVSVTAVEGISTKAGSSPAREGDENRLQSTKQEAVNIPYVPGKPSLEYKATKDAQQAWEASKEYRVPTLIKYTVEDDPRIHWQKRMAAMRSIWAGKDAADKKKREEEAAARTAEAQKQAKAAQAAAQERAAAESNSQQKAGTQQAAAQQQAATHSAAAAPQAPAQPASGPSTAATQGSTPAVAQPAVNTASVQPAVNTAAPVQPVQPVAAASAATGGAVGTSAAAAAAAPAQLAQPQVRPAAPNAAVQSASGTAAAPARGAAPQGSAQAPAAVQGSVEANGTTTAAATGDSRSGQAAAAQGQTQQWHNMLQYRLNNRTRPLSQVIESSAAATAQAPASAAGASSAKSNAPANTLQESISYVTQASQDQLVTAYHEMQKHLEQNQQDPGGSSEVKDEVKTELQTEIKLENDAKVKFEAK